MFFNTATSRSNARRGTGRSDRAVGDVTTGESTSLLLDADADADSSPDDAELGVTSAGSGASMASNTRLPI